MPLLPTLLAVDPLLFAFRESTLPGKLILGCLFIASIFSWSVMVTKIRVIQHARRRTEDFLEQFRADRMPLRIYETGVAYDGAPLYEVYHAGCQEMTYHLLGSTEVDETFHDRLEIADKVTPAQLHAVTAIMERAVGEEALRLESQLILLSTTSSSRKEALRSTSCFCSTAATGAGIARVSAPMPPGFWRVFPSWWCRRSSSVRSRPRSTRSTSRG